MKRLILTVAVLILVCLSASSAYAVGTPAGTVIHNTAKATYNAGLTATSNDATVTVAEVINVTVTWQDAAPVAVAPSELKAVTKFKVTNTGNGTEPFTLVGSGALGGDDFDPTGLSIWFDTNGNGVYDSGGDTLYTGGNNPNLTSTGAATDSVTVFVLSDIPAGLLDGKLGFVNLTATSMTGTGAAGTKFAGAGDGGVDAIIGATTGTAVVIGKYVVSTVLVGVVKTATVLPNPPYGTVPISGSTVHYSLAVTATGSSSALGVVITDPIPAFTTYKLGTLTLDGGPLTDILDPLVDKGDVGGTTAGTVTVTLGNMAGAPPATHTITFDVIIN